MPRTVISTASLASTRSINRGSDSGRALHAIGLDRADFRDGVAEVAQQLECARSLGIGDARLGHDVNDGPGSIQRGYYSGSIV